MQTQLLQIELVWLSQVKQMYAGPNSALPQRLGVADTLPEDARCATSNLITGVPKVEL